jgi:RNA polymerase sigma-70 factor, ECF subfamily
VYQDIAQIAVKETADEDLALVQSSQNGETAAFEELIKRYDRKLLHIALNVTRNPEDAEEAVQDTFLKAYRNLNRFEGKAKFATWLTRIAINESLTKLRKQHGNKETSLERDIRLDGEVLPLDVADWAPNPEERYGVSQLRDILTKSLQELRPALRVVFVLRDVEGFSTSETAEALRLTQASVKARLFRARLELRERLSKYFRKSARTATHLPSTQQYRRTPSLPTAVLKIGMRCSTSSVPVSTHSLRQCQLVSLRERDVVVKTQRS